MKACSRPGSESAQEPTLTCGFLILLEVWPTRCHEQLSTRATVSSSILSVSVKPRDHHGCEPKAIRAQLECRLASAENLDFLNMRKTR